MSEPTPGEWVAAKRRNDSWAVKIETTSNEGILLDFAIASDIYREADARLMASAKVMATIIERLKDACRRDSTFALTHILWRILGDEPETVSDPRRLAYAVLDGDEQAALILADEVHEQFIRGKGFVPREELEQQLADAKTPLGVRAAFMALDPRMAWEMALELPLPNAWRGVASVTPLDTLLPAVEANP